MPLKYWVNYIRCVKDVCIYMCVCDISDLYIYMICTHTNAIKFLAVSQTSLSQYIVSYYEAKLEELKLSSGGRRLE